MSAVPKGYKQVGTLNTAKGLDDGGAIPAGTTFAIVVPQDQSVRWRDDGVDPTAALGMLLPAGTMLTVGPGQLARIKFIEVVAGAEINVSFYK